MNAVTLLFTLAVATSLAGQSARGTTAPLGYETKSGDFFARNFGCYSDGRHQMVDGTLRGKVLVLKGVDYRLDESANYGPFNGTGRSWTRVALHVNDGDIPKLTATFSSNILNPRTRLKVFDSKLSWPTLTGRPSKTPWGAPVGFGFSSPFVYLGKLDLLLDYTFEGGKLSNGFSWSFIDQTGATRGRFVGYDLDGIYFGGLAYGYPTLVPGNPGSTGNQCNDSAHKSKTKTGAYAYHDYVVHSDGFVTASLRGKGRCHAYTYYTAPNATVIAALTLNGSDKGIAAGFACNNLHMNLQQQIVVMTKTTGMGSGWSGEFFPLAVTYDATVAGLTTYFQAAWNDSSTGRASLTIASKSVLPQKPSVLPKRAVHHNSVSSKVAYGVYDYGFLQSLPLLHHK